MGRVCYAQYVENGGGETVAGVFDYFIVSITDISELPGCHGF